MPMVLLCDDEADIRLLCRTAFELQGWEVAEAQSGQEALDVVVRLDPAPDCLVMDVMMPELDGIETVIELRQHTELHRPEPLPVILLSARATDADVERGLNAGADDYVTKPFSPLGLVAAAAAQLAS